MRQFVNRHKMSYSTKIYLFGKWSVMCLDDLFLESVLAIPISQTEKLKKGSFL